MQGFPKQFLISMSPAFREYNYIIIEINRNSNSIIYFFIKITRSGGKEMSNINKIQKEKQLITKKYSWSARQLFY